MYYFLSHHARPIFLSCIIVFVCYECNLCSELGKGVLFVCFVLLGGSVLYFCIYPLMETKYLIFWIIRSRRNIRTRIWARNDQNHKNHARRIRIKIRRIRTRITRIRRIRTRIRTRFRKRNRIIRIRTRIKKRNRIIRRIRFTRIRIRRRIRKRSEN